MITLKHASKTERKFLGKNKLLKKLFGFMLVTLHLLHFLFIIIAYYRFKRSDIQENK
jgi:ABC-type transport system involved in multi-copper enzyme maturation permease subunit